MVDIRKSTNERLRPLGQSSDCDDMENDSNQFADIGERLSQLRKHERASQKAWAEKHNFNATQYNNWERGSRRIPLEYAEALCDRYGLTLDFIYRGRVDGLSENARKIF